MNDVCSHGVPLSASCFDCRSPRELTPGEERSLERYAQLSAKYGQLRRACLAARNTLLRHEHTAANPGYPYEALQILSEALNDAE